MGIDDEIRISGLIEEDSIGVKNRFGIFCDQVMALEGSMVTIGDRQDDIYKGWGISKLELLTRLSTGKFKNADSIFVYDNNGVGHNLATIMKEVDDSWTKDGSFGEKLDADDCASIIESSWLMNSIKRAENFASQVGGKVLVVDNPALETGVSTVILFPKAESLKMDEERLHRGIATQGVDDVLNQVSGMLRSGFDSRGQDLQSFRSKSTVIQDEAFRDLVHKLASDPSLELYNQVIEYYKENGYSNNEASARYVGLDSLKTLLKSEKGMKEALQRLHRGLNRGVVGVSPYVATTAEVESLRDFLNENGGVVVLNVPENKICDRRNGGEDEVLVAGEILPEEIVAFIPINFIGDDQEYNKEITLGGIRQAEEAIDLYLSIEVD